MKENVALIPLLFVGGLILFLKTFGWLIGVDEPRYEDDEL